MVDIGKAHQTELYKMVHFFSVISYSGKFLAKPIHVELSMGKRNKIKMIFHRQTIEIDCYFSEFLKGCQRCTIYAQLLLTDLLIFRDIFTTGKNHQASSGLIYLFNQKRNKYRFSTGSIYFACIQLDEFSFWLAIATTTFYYILEQPSRMINAVEAKDKMQNQRGFLGNKQLFHQKLSKFLLKTIFQNSDLHVQAFPANYHQEQNNFLARINKSMEESNKKAGAIFGSLGDSGVELVDRGGKSLDGFAPLVVNRSTERDEETGHRHIRSSSKLGGEGGRSLLGKDALWQHRSAADEMVYEGQRQEERSRSLATEGVEFENKKKEREEIERKEVSESQGHAGFLAMRVCGGSAHTGSRTIHVYARWPHD